MLEGLLARVKIAGNNSVKQQLARDQNIDEVPEGNPQQEGGLVGEQRKELGRFEVQAVGVD